MALFTMYDLRDAYREIARKGDWVSVPQLLEAFEQYGDEGPAVTEADVESAIATAAELAPGFQRADNGEFRYIV